MKKVLLILALTSFVFWGQLSACDNSTMSITNAVDNMDGTTTYTLDIEIELGGLDLDYYGFILLFNSLEGAPSINSFSPAVINPTMGLNEPLTGLTGASINSLASDGDFAPYTGDANALSYEYDYVLFGNAADDNFTMTIDVTINGCAEEILLLSHPNGSASCTESIGITNVTAGSQSACSIVDNTYTQEVTVSYSGITTPANLIVNGQSFPVTSSPQTVTLTGLTADGAAVDVNAEISNALTCPAMVTGLFTAPAACAVVSCSVDNVALGTQTACVPATNNYTQQVIITYSNPPSSGTLDVNGQSFAIGTSPQTVTLTGLTADGNAVNGTVEFSADTGCNDTVSFTAPASCSISCTADNGTWD